MLFRNRFLLLLALAALLAFVSLSLQFCESDQGAEGGGVGRGLPHPQTNDPLGERNQ